RIAPEDISLLEWGIEEAARLEDAGVDDPAERYAAFFGRLGMLRTEVKDKSGVVRYPRHEHIGGNMAAKLLKHMGVEHILAEKVKGIIQERGEVRRRAELQAKRAKQRDFLQKQQNEKEKRRKERAARHRLHNSSNRNS
ncbi:MAG: hypothetical protein K2G13_09480, partial [Muribaculaceae bacterium]|nr:hypothetical protein [Muribaculaceae bacterium]